MAAVQLFEERQRRVVVVGVPLRGNRPDDLIQGAFGQLFFDALKPRREGSIPVTPWYTRLRA